MLQPYIYVSHSMEKMQEFIDYIFFHVWCKVSKGVGFSLHLFDGHPELQAILQGMWYETKENDTADIFWTQIEDIYNVFQELEKNDTADNFLTQIENIYYVFRELTVSQIEQLTVWYVGNNNIEKACANENSACIARYADIKTINIKLAAKLKTFFMSIYSGYINPAQLKQSIQTVDAHYKQFVQRNTAGVCLFCGLNPMKGPFHSKREAYDHYLPKSIYPFCSINFHNLVPTCHECNSSYKGAKDPLHLQGKRRKAFYPYSTKPHSITVQVDISEPPTITLCPDDITLTISSSQAEEVETWKELYSIDERYIAKCAGADGKYWLAQRYDEWINEGRSPHTYMESLKRQAQVAPLAESNFLKLAFLEGYQRAGFFDSKVKDEVLSNSLSGVRNAGVVG